MSMTTASRLGRIAIIGGGNMGQAICAGLLCVEGLQPSSITVANPGAEKRSLIASRYGVCTVENCVDALPADTVFLAVKPAKVPEVLEQLAGAGFDDGLLISVAAGVSTEKMSSYVSPQVDIVRVMPNTPLTCGAGMSALSAGAGTSQERVELARQVFALMGEAVIVDEGMQDIVTAISGSGPAYFELFIQCMAKAGGELGLDESIAQKLALSTMAGTAKMIACTGQDLDQAIKAVSSPGGTTVAALDAMRAGGVCEAIEAGVKAAAARSKELGA